MFGAEERLTAKGRKITKQLSTAKRHFLIYIDECLSLNASYRLILTNNFSIAQSLPHD